MTAIDVENISFGYGKELVLDKLSFQVMQGRILGLLGKNGVGKSTLFNLLNGFLIPKTGTIKLFDEEAGKLSTKTKTRIGYLIEGHEYRYLHSCPLLQFLSTPPAAAFSSLISSFALHCLSSAQHPPLPLIDYSTSGPTKVWIGMTKGCLSGPNKRLIFTRA